MYGQLMARLTRNIHVRFIGNILIVAHRSDRNVSIRQNQRAQQRTPFRVRNKIQYKISTLLIGSLLWRVCLNYMVLCDSGG